MALTGTLIKRAVKGTDLLATDFDGNMDAIASAVDAQATTLAGKVDSTSKGVANGVASLDGTGKVPAGQLPTAATPTAAGTTFAPAGNIAATNVQSAIAELDTEKADAAATTSALGGKVSSTLLGAANGVATLGSDGKLTAAQIPSGLGGGASGPAPLYDRFGGVPAAGDEVFFDIAKGACTIPAGLAGAIIKSTKATTNPVTLTIKVNGVSKGSIAFNASSQAPATITFASAVALVAGDIVTVEMPGTADATFGNIMIYIVVS